MKWTLITFVTLTVLGTGSYSIAEDVKPQKETKAPVAKKRLAEVEKKKATPAVEVVFVLDTTGSMSGLIQAAKEKIWSIANTLATSKPAPTIKIGLVGYRDRGKEEYITKVTDLNEDLDAIFKELMGYKAAGGGDGPESVNQALHEAVTQVKWSKDDKTYRVIFLVGDAPPHMDYKGDVLYPQVCEMAAKAEIVINTVQCGNNQTAVTPWSKIAKLAEGSYFKVEQNGGTILAETPYDVELSKLSITLGKSQIYYGKADKRAMDAKTSDEARATFKGASYATKARRAEFKSKLSAKGGRSGRAFSCSSDLIQACEDKYIKLEDVPKNELPKELQKLSKKELKAYIEKKTVERKVILKEITALGLKRQKYIKLEIAKQTKEKKGSFDQAIYTCIQTQAAKKGMKYSGGLEQ